MFQRLILFLIFAIILNPPEAKSKENSFPLKKEVVRKSKITVLASYINPFVFYETHSLKGLDIDIIENFAKISSLTIDYIVKNDTLHEKNFDSAKNSKIDVLIGAIRENPLIHNGFIASRSYHHNHLTWCVQRSQPILKWKNIFHLCRDPYVYIASIVTASISFFVFYYLQKLQRRIKWDLLRLFFDAFGGALGLPVAFYAENNSIRMHLICLLFAAIIFSTIVRMSLEKIIMSPILSPQIKSPQEIINGNFDLVGDQFTFEKLSQWNETYDKILLNRFKVVNRPDEYLHYLKWNDKLAVAVPYELAHSHTQMGNDQFNARRDVYCFDRWNNIYEYPLKILVRVDFPLLNELNHFIKYASDSGLVDKWLREYRSNGRETFQISHISFETEYLYVLYTLYGFMSLVALVTFVFERIVYEKVRTPNSSPYWLFIEMCIDPYRYFFLDSFDWISQN